MSGVDKTYCLARRALLDALDALGEHRTSLVLVGAQAVYEWTGDFDIGLAPYTIDADMMLDITLLTDSPPIEKLLERGGFEPESASSIGIWKRSGGDASTVQPTVDLLVPAFLSPEGRRSARLDGHGHNVARKADGLEGALRDRELRVLSAFEEEDSRKFEIHVAGPGALLVAKLIKIQDRSGSGRLVDKDALDLFRILRAIDTNDLAERLRSLLADDSARDATGRALEALRLEFGNRGGGGIDMLRRSAGTAIDPDELTTACVILSTALLRALGK